MKNRKQWLGLGLCFCLAFLGTAYGAEAVLPARGDSRIWAAGVGILEEETRLAGPGDANQGVSPAGPGIFGSPSENPVAPDNGSLAPSGANPVAPDNGSLAPSGVNPVAPDNGSLAPNGGSPLTGPGVSDHMQMTGPGEAGEQPSMEQPEALYPAPAGETGVAALAEPEILAEGAVLLDGATGKVLYGKNADQQFFPASITKVMTALLVLERCSLGDIVTFSASATTNLESGAVSLNLTEGDQLTVEQCLYGLLLKSANEIGNGLAEHISGSVDGFAQLMNARARELGCTNTNFVNPHGLNNANHKTTPHDMALIMRAALQQQDFRRIDTTCTYEFPATKKEGVRTLTMGHKMMHPSDSRYYQGIVGGKTGYTSLAGNTLVTAVERDGVQLIVVVMKANQSHYTDTKALLDYGFANYGTLMGR